MEIEQALFDILFSGLKDAKSEYLTSVYTVIAANLAGIGWVLSSKETREFYASHLKIRVSTIVGVSFLAIFHWGNIFLMASRSFETYGHMLENKFYIMHKDKLTLDPYVIDWFWPYASCLFTASLFSMFIYLIISCRKPNKQIN